MYRDVDNSRMQNASIECQYWHYLHFMLEIILYYSYYLGFQFQLFQI